MKRKKVKGCGDVKRTSPKEKKGGCRLFVVEVRLTEEIFRWAEGEKEVHWHGQGSLGLKFRGAIGRGGSFVLQPPNWF